MAIDKIDKVVLNRELVKEIENKATKAEVTDTKLELQNQINAVVTSLDYKEAVSTFKDLQLLYPSPKEGWTVAVKENGITYKYTNSIWVDIGLTSTPKATSSNDGLFTKEDYKKLSTINEGAESNFTPDEILEIIKSIDGTGSGLDADMIQGKVPSDFASSNHNHDGRYYTESQANTLLNGKANNSHSHTQADITDFSHEHDVRDIKDLKQCLDKKSDVHSHPYASDEHTHNDIYYTEKEIDESLFKKADASHSHKKSEITDFTHEHAINDIKNLQTSLDKKADSSHTHPVSDMVDFSHGHVIADVKDLQATLNNKSNIHNHPYADENHNHDGMYYTETEIDDFLSGKANTKHTHVAADINNNAVTDVKIGNRTINQEIATVYANSANLTPILSWYAKRFKELLGLDNWFDNVPISLSAIWGMFKTDTGHKHTGVDGDGAKISYKDLSDCPMSFTPATHKHAKADITDFTHSHAISEITNLQTALNGKSDTNHTHENLGAKVNIGATAPTSPKVNEIWIDTN